MIPFDLLPFFGLGSHQGQTFILTLLIGRKSLEGGVSVEMCHDPAVDVLDVTDGIHDPPRSQHKGVLGVERGGDDAGLVLSGLEVRIGKADEDLPELSLGEEVGEELHAVGT